MSSNLDRNLKSYLLEVTPEIAKAWLMLNNYENQRPIRKGHVDFLADEMAKGRFVPGTPIRFGVLDGMHRLVNGQHTLSAIVKSGCAQQLTITSSDVIDKGELAELYFRHDAHLTRTIADALRAIGGMITPTSGKKSNGSGWPCKPWPSLR